MNTSQWLAAVGILGALGGFTGAATAAAAAAGAGIPLGNPPVRSAGCGKPAAITAGKHAITSSGQQRTYIIDIPAS